MIKWPVNEDVPSGGGISYGELIVNLLLITQKPLPRVISKGSNGYTEYGDPVACSDFLLLPWSMDEAAITLMIHTTYFLHKYFGFEIFPAHLKTKSKMLVAWGSRRIVSGFRSRPMLPWSECHQKIFRQLSELVDGISHTYRKLTQVLFVVKTLSVWRQRPFTPIFLNFRRRVEISLKLVGCWKHLSLSLSVVWQHLPFCRFTAEFSAESYLALWLCSFHLSCPCNVLGLAMGVSQRGDLLRSKWSKWSWGT